jgi:hypothetical protein
MGTSKLLALTHTFRRFFEAGAHFSFPQRTDTGCHTPDDWGRQEKRALDGKLAREF